MLLKLFKISDFLKLFKLLIIDFFKLRVFFLIKKNFFLKIYFYFLVKCLCQKLGTQERPPARAPLNRLHLQF